MSSIGAVERRFQEMSASRDVETHSVTEGTGRAVEGGYIRELISRSPRAGGGPETTTSRTVFTKTEQPEQRRTTPSLQRLEAHDVQRPLPRDTQYTATSGTSNTFTTSSASDNSALGTSTRGALSRSISNASPSPGATHVGASPLPTLPQPRQEPTYASTSFSPTPSVSSTSTTTRSVIFGSTTTRVVEPSRLSPLKVDTEYSPVAYKTKREWRRLQREKQQQHDQSLASKIRCSSVPRLDEAVAFNRRPQQQTSSGALPYGETTQRGFQAGGHGSHHQQVEEDLFLNQEPVPSGMFGAGRDGGISAGSGGTSRSSSRGNASTYGANDGGGQPNNGGYDPYHAEALYEHNRPRQGNRRSPINGGRQQPGPSRSYAPQVVDMGYAEEENGSEYDAPSSRGSSRGGSSVRTNSYLSNTPARRAALQQHDDITLQEFGRVLGTVRGHSHFPAPPEHGNKAFALLNRGTYLIKYGVHGPHERYVSLRMIHDNRTRMAAPFLVWQTHDKSVSVNERLHLSHLAVVATGTKSANFSRHMVGPNMIKGPHVGSSKPNLESSCAFTLVFRSETMAREVDLLAMDEQTYRCWLLVADYIVSVNSLDGGSYREEDVESLAGESASPSLQ